MDFQNALFLSPAIAGACFILVGLLMSRFPPRKINAFYGYKTPASMYSQERWDFAQIYAAKEMMKAGIFLVLFSVPGIFIEFQQGLEILIGIAFVLLVVIITIVRTEKAIKNKFENKTT